MSMVQAGPATDAVIDEIAPHLDEGDILIDGGNANFRDTQRRHAKLAEQGIHFLGVGVSGGEEGALNGPSIMPGGDREPYDESVKPIFEAIAAKVDGTPCCTYVGPDGAGHYVKMVHNGIEYADMQLIAESYDLLRHGVGLDVPEIAERFRAWNDSELESFLIEITARVLAKTDEATGKPLVDVILDAAEQKGTGRWTAQDALELGVPLTGITEAVFARTLSALKDRARARRRRARGAGADGAARRRRWPTTSSTRCTRRRSSPTPRASPRWRPPPTSEGWDIDLGSMATIWRGGCIIRARFLDRIREAYDERARAWPTSCSPTSSPTRWSRPRTRGAAWSARAAELGHPHAGVLLVAGLLRRLPPRARAGQPHPGPARPVRRPHLQARRPRGHVPHHVGRRRPRGRNIDKAGPYSNAGAIGTRGRAKASCPGWSTVTRTRAQVQRAVCAAPRRSKRQRLTWA